jgi:hypothetical protein
VKDKIGRRRRGSTVRDVNNSLEKFYDNARINGGLVPPMTLNNRWIEGGRRTGRSQGVAVVSASTNTVENGRSPCMDPCNLFLRECRGEPRRGETGIALVNVDVVLKVPGQGYALVVGSHAGIPGGDGERLGELCEECCDGQLAVVVVGGGHDVVVGGYIDGGVELVFRGQRRRPFVCTEKPDHRQEKHKL